MGVYKYLVETWKSRKSNDDLKEIWRERLIKWRKEKAIVRIDKPTRIDRAKALGYKAKQGVIVVRVRIRKGDRRRPSPRRGRKSTSVGKFIPPTKSLQWIAEERANKKYPNMEVLNSYYVAEDGMYKWFEVILVDRAHPSIKSDKELNGIAKQRGRVHRGLTKAGRRVRGLLHKGRRNIKKVRRKHKVKGD